MRNLSIRYVGRKNAGAGVASAPALIGFDEFRLAIPWWVLSSRATSASPTGGSVPYTQFAGREIYSERRPIS